MFLSYNEELVKVLVLQFPLIGLGILASVYFLFIYFLMAGIFCAIKLLAAEKYLITINKTRAFPNQTLFEIKNSLVSVLIFGIYACVLVVLLRHNYILVDFNFKTSTLLIDIGILLVWNEIHFFLMHSLLHTPFLHKKVHIIHHRSVLTTPFSTYSFHWIEALMLGSVMIFIVPFYTFQISSLMLFPIVSLFFNTMAHSNIQFFQSSNMRNLFSFSQRHNYHHTKAKSGKGFISPYLDILFKNQL